MAPLSIQVPAGYLTKPARAPRFRRLKLTGSEQQFILVRPFSH